MTNLDEPLGKKALVTGSGATIVVDGGLTWNYSEQ
jgi:hypothetical protein